MCLHKSLAVLIYALAGIKQIKIEILPLKNNSLMRIKYN